MEQKIKDVIKKYYAYKHNGVLADDTPDQKYEGIITECGKRIGELDRDSHRWWDTYTEIKRFDVSDDKFYLIGYEFASANRDESIYDLGYEFDPDTISFYEEYEVVSKDYAQLSCDKVDV